jgi:hypothetical protein
MRRAVVPITPRSTVRDREPSPLDRGLGSVTALTDRLRSYGIVRDRGTEKPDTDLVRLASALLECRMMLDPALGLTLSIDAVWLLLLIYIRQAEAPGVTLAALSESPITGSGTVTLRWTAKLVNDRLVQLSENSERPAEPFVRLSSVGFTKLESWLRTSQSHLGREL